MGATRVNERELRTPATGRSDRRALPRALPRLMVELALVAFFLVQAAIVNPAVDFLAFYTAGMQVLAGRPELIFSFEAVAEAQAGYEILGGGLFPFWYPPLYSALFAPLVVVPMPVARVVWGLLAFLAARGALVISREWSGAGRRGTLLLLAFPPLWIALTLGQMSPFTLLIFAAIALMMWRGEVGLLTGALAGIALYKPQLLVPLLLLWLLRREWRALAGFVATGLVILIGSWLLSPAALYDYFFEAPRFMPLMQEELAARGTVTTLATILGWIVPEGLAALLAAAAIIGSLLVAWWRRPVTRYHHALLWFAAVLATPYLGHYDLMLLLLPITFLVPYLRGDRVLIGGLALLAVSFLPWSRGGGLVAPVLVTGLLYALSLARALRPPAAVTTPVESAVGAPSASSP